MTRRHFAIFTHMGNGHVYPVLPLCTALSKRGHYVTYVTNEHYARTIKEAGAEPILFRNRRMSDDAKEQTRAGLHLPTTDPRFKAMLKAWRLHFFSDTTQLLSQVDEFYHRNAPDLILYDRYHIPGRIMAKRLDIPAVQITSSFALYNNLAIRINGTCENPEAVVEWSKEVDSFLSAQGITSNGSYWHVEQLNIHLIPKEFQYHSNHFDERFCFTGTLLDRPFRPIWKDHSNGKPIILVSGMSQWNDAKIDCSSFFDMFIDAFSSSPYHCILSVGDDDYFRITPPNFEINRQASHLEILPCAALLICHGGMTSTLEAIYNGVPVLMIPPSVGTAEVAYRAKELGLGICLSQETVSVDIIRDTVAEMLRDNALRKRVADMRDLFIRSGGADLAVNRIERYLAESRR